MDLKRTDVNFVHESENHEHLETDEIKLYSLRYDVIIRINYLAEFLDDGNKPLSTIRKELHDLTDSAFNIYLDNSR